jgi:hypothetical protein
LRPVRRCRRICQCPRRAIRCTASFRRTCSRISRAAPSRGCAPSQRRARHARRERAAARRAPGARRRGAAARDAGGRKATHDLRRARRLHAAGPNRARRGHAAGAATWPVNEAYDGLGATFDLYHDAYGRNSIDDRGLRLDASVHYRERFNNAFWNGRQMVFGDGDGVIFGRFTRCIDVIGHELTHGVTQFEAGLDYEGQAGALNESFSDVFGSLVKQYALGQTAEQADWLIGAGLFAAGVKGRALRSMRAPGTAYDDPRIGRDPQPAHMRDYVDTTDDNGGVHINSGIPNRAFCMAATSLGGQAWKQAGAIWYRALTDVLRGASNFRMPPRRPLGSRARTSARMRPRACARRGRPWGSWCARLGTRRKEPGSANSNRAERRSRRAPSRAGRRDGASTRRRV